MNSLSDQDIQKRDIFESWGYTVAYLSAGSPQAVYDDAVVMAGPSGVVFVSEEVSHVNVNTKLVGQKIGIVIEENELIDEFGMIGPSINLVKYADTNEIYISDNSHYITEGLEVGYAEIFHTSFNLAYYEGVLASGVQSLGKNPAGGWFPSLLVVEKGALLHNDMLAQGRRVVLPWGHLDMDFSYLSDLGKQVLLRRSIEWCMG